MPPRTCYRRFCGYPRSVAAVLALDIGGTKMAGAVVDDSGEMLASERIDTPPSLHPETLWEPLAAMCHKLIANERVVAVGVGCGGPMRYPEGIVSPINIPGWRDFPLRERLENAVQLPVTIDNDAKALAVGERWRGAGHGSNNMLGMVVSTGVGGGIILEGQLLHGESGNAGHVGHIIVWPGGPVCGCGAHGCVEGVASGTGLARRLNEAIAAREQPSGRSGTSVARELATGMSAGLTAAQIAECARAGDELGLYLFRTAGEGVGRGIASAAALLDLECVVLGGSIALRAWDLLGPSLESELRASARLDFSRDVRVVHAELGDRAGLFGAAQLALSLL
jgi:glucokinase